MLGPNAIFAGDFNSNAIWDKPRREWNHSNCIRELEDLGFCSAYHHVYQEQQGLESNPTFYLHRHLSRPYHIDFVFLHENRAGSAAIDLQVGGPSDWLALSDHMPILVDV